MTEPIVIDAPGKPGASTKPVPPAPTKVPAEIPHPGVMLGGLINKRQLAIAASAVFSLVAGIAGVRLMWPTSDDSRQQGPTQPLPAEPKPPAPPRVVAQAVPPASNDNIPVTRLPVVTATSGNTDGVPGPMIPLPPPSVSTTVPPPPQPGGPSFPAVPLPPPQGGTGTPIPQPSSLFPDVGPSSPAVPPLPGGPGGATPPRPAQSPAAPGGISPIPPSVLPASGMDIKPPLPALPGTPAVPASPGGGTATLPIPAPGSLEPGSTAAALPTPPSVPSRPTTPANPPGPAATVTPMPVGVTPPPSPSGVVPPPPSGLIPPAPSVSVVPPPSNLVPVGPAAPPATGGSPPAMPPATPPPSPAGSGTTLLPIPGAPNSPATPPAAPSVQPPTPPSIQPVGTETPGGGHVITMTKPAVAPAAVTSPDRMPSTTYDVDIYQPKNTDSWASISQDFYNDARYAAGLEAYNQRKGKVLHKTESVDIPPLHVVKKYQSGQVQVPRGTSNSTPAPTYSPAPTVNPVNWNTSTPTSPVNASTLPKVYTVPRGGMRLTEMAKVLLGSEQQWREIWNLNEQFSSPSDIIPAGTNVKVPASARIPAGENR